MRRREAFTLVELLVVIAIISVLMALLSPMLWKARRKAIVLASPIVYLGQDNRLHLVDPRGGDGLELTAPTQYHREAITGQVIMPPVAWSPSGLRIVCSIIERPTVQGGENHCVGILDPLSWTLKEHPALEDSHLVGWSDSNTFIELGRNPGYPRNGGENLAAFFRDADTGAVQRVVQVSREVCLAPFYSSPAPPGSPGPYITSWSGRVDGVQLSTIEFRRKDFSRGKLVWQESDTYNRFPQVDPTGEWIAWSRGTSSMRVAIKRVSDHSSVRPTLLGEQFPVAYLSCWTPDGNLLITTAQGWTSVELAFDMAYVIIDKNGKVIRKLPTAVRPLPNASWRNYGHQ